MHLSVNARRGEAIVAGVLFVVGMAFSWAASQLPMGDAALPGPGFFPFVLGILLAMAGIGVMIRLVRLGRIEETRGTGETVAFGHRPVVLTFLALLLVPLFFERAGAVVTLGVFAALVVVIVGRSPWWRAAAGSALGMVAAWYFFKILLGVQLPAGMF